MKRLLLLALVLAGLAAGLAAAHHSTPEWYARHLPAWLARRVYPLEHRAAISAAAARNRLDPALVAGLIYAESGYRETAVSDEGAVGLMQVLPSTAREIARRTGGVSFEAADLWDPAVNIRYGSRYLRMLMDRYDGSRLEAVAAYNAGAGNVDAWRRAAGGRLTSADIAFPETRQYVAEVTRLAYLYDRAYRGELDSP